MAYQLHDYSIIVQPSVTKLGDIKILFNDVLVPRVVVTQLAVWNAGNTVIKGTEIVESDRLRFCCEEGAEVVNAQRVNETKAANGFRITASQDDHCCAFLDFDYLNGGDGAKFQIIHTGSANKSKVLGSLRGIPNGVENWGDLQEWSSHKSRGLGLLVPLGVPAIFLILIWLKSLIAPHYPAINVISVWMIGILGGIVVLLMLSGVIFMMVYTLRTRSRMTPKSLSRN
jgi:hypothetical protein